MLERMTRAGRGLLTTVSAWHRQFNQRLVRYHWLHQFVRANELYVGGVLGYQLLAWLIGPLAPISWAIFGWVWLALIIYLVAARAIALQAGRK